MNIDTGLAVVIIAVLIFYLRLIGMQRERVKRLSQAEKKAGKKQSKAKGQAQAERAQYSIISQNRRDWVIGGCGVAAVVLGVLLYLNIFPFPAAQTYWWIPTALGIVAFSWLFRL